MMEKSKNFIRKRQMSHGDIIGSLDQSDDNPHLFLRYLS